MKLISLVSVFGIMLVISTANAESVRTSDEVQHRIQEVASGIAVGQNYATQYLELINKYALKYNISPDWIKAIIIAEAIRPKSDSKNHIAPTGLDAKWAGLDGIRIDQFTDVETNIRLCALLLQRIRDRMPENRRDFRFVASLYNDIEAKTVSEYGLKAEKILEEKVWLKINTEHNKNVHTDAE